jgi:putative transcriptional regulator
MIGEEMMGGRYRSDALAAIQETMAALRDVGAIGKRTMRRFDDACLTPIQPLKIAEAKAIKPVSPTTST